MRSDTWTRKRAMRLKAALAVMVAVVGGGCAGKAPQEQGPFTGSDSLRPRAYPSIDYDHPLFGEGVEVASVADAQSRVTFDVYTPRIAHNPHIFVSSTLDDPNLALVYFVFDDDRYGRLVVAEGHPEVADPASRLAGYEALVATNGQPDVHSIAEIVYIRGGIPALRGHADFNDHGTIEWVEDGVQFKIMGPSITQEEATAAADDL